MGSASDWLNQISHAARPIRSTTQICAVTRHQYGISALVSHTSFGRETSGSVTKCRLFSQATLGPVLRKKPVPAESTLASSSNFIKSLLRGSSDLIYKMEKRKKKEKKASLQI